MRYDKRIINFFVDFDSKKDIIYVKIKIEIEMKIDYNVYKFVIRYNDFCFKIIFDKKQSINFSLLSKNVFENKSFDNVFSIISRNCFKNDLIENIKKIKYIKFFIYSMMTNF